MKYLFPFFFWPLFLHAQTDPLQWVNPFIGTDAHGHTFPGATAPFGLVQLSPDTRLEGWDGCSGYHYSDSLLYGFSHTHLSGTGVPDYCDVLFQPFTGAMPLENTEYASTFKKSTEKAEAGYYAVTLDKYRIRAEMTATAHTGVHRYTFPANKEKGGIVIDLRHRDSVLQSAMRIISDREVEGVRVSKSWSAEQKVYFVTRFSRPFFQSIALDMSANPRIAERQIDSRAIVGVFQFYNAAEPLVAVTAISPISTEDARQRLEAECPHFDFDRIKKETQAIWRKQLSKIAVEGGTNAQKTTFYTALYHTMCVPNELEPGRYSVFSLWDTYRAAHPLYTLLEPERTRHFIGSFMEHYRVNGRLPVWELWGRETDCMIGNHAISVMADAAVKGILPNDAAAAVQAAKETMLKQRAGLDLYAQKGYVPAQSESESVSKTLEYAYDDWCVAQLADALGDRATAATFRQRAAAYRNTFDAQTGFFRAKNNAIWHTPFTPSEVNFHYTEANAWQYRFTVQHDINGLMALMGGRKRFSEALDSLFQAPAATTGRDQVDITGLIGQYAHGNEPSHHVAYLYNYAGEPAKTQRRVRQIMDELYSDRPDGLCGNEDCGQMSAWYVFSALGFYPVVPGRPEYVLGTPLFEKATLHLDNGKTFTIQAPGTSKSRFFVEKAALNGQNMPQTRLAHADIVQGGTLTFQMADTPGQWGTDAAACPQSALETMGALPPPVPYIQSGQQAFRGTQSIALADIDPDAAIFYALQKKGKTDDFKRYTRPFNLKTAATLLFYAEKNGQKSPVEQVYLHQIPEGLRVQEYHTAFSPQYNGQSEWCLTDGLRGNRDFRTGGWQGFEGKNVDFTLDLGSKQTLASVSLGCLQDENSWIFFPTDVHISASTDGKNYQPFGSVQNTVPALAPGILFQDLTVSADPAWRNKKIRYLRITAASRGLCPPGHKGAGYSGWVFVDEVVLAGK
jgi:predicted alpha-1,2-mannosidase